MFEARALFVALLSSPSFQYDNIRVDYGLHIANRSCAFLLFVIATSAILGSS